MDFFIPILSSINESTNDFLLTFQQSFSSLYSFLFFSFYFFNSSLQFWLVCYYLQMTYVLILEDLL